MNFVFLIERPFTPFPTNRLSNMPKAEVDINIATHAELQDVLRPFGLELKSHHKCYGGFSGSNYACELTSGGKVLLKCTNDQPQADVEAQIAALLFFKRAPTAPRTCYPRPLVGAEDLSLPANYITMVTGSPSIVLDFLPGLPASASLAVPVYC